jgi:hypothetical protein
LVAAVPLAVAVAAAVAAAAALAAEAAVGTVAVAISHNGHMQYLGRRDRPTLMPSRYEPHSVPNWCAAAAPAAAAALRVGVPFLLA